MCFVLTVLAAERQSVAAAATHSLAQDLRTVTSFSFIRTVNDREASMLALGNFTALFLPFFGDFVSNSLSNIFT